MNDKPIECANCQNKANIIYKEFASGKMEMTEMCSECPLLKKKLCVGSKAEETPIHEPTCSCCSTKLSQLQRGERLGCSECYNTFTEHLIQNLSEENHLPIPMDTPSIKGKAIPLHVGRSPCRGEQKGALSARLETLHIALGEAIAIENYEQAASLRDQIRELMERHHEAS